MQGTSVKILTLLDWTLFTLSLLFSHLLQTCHGRSQERPGKSQACNWLLVVLENKSGFTVIFKFSPLLRLPLHIVSAANNCLVSGQPYSWKAGLWKKKGGQWRLQTLFRETSWVWWYKLLLYSCYQGNYHLIICISSYLSSSNLDLKTLFNNKSSLAQWLYQLHTN